MIPTNTDNSGKPEIRTTTSTLNLGKLLGSLISTLGSQPRRTSGGAWIYTHLEILHLILRSSSVQITR